MTAVFDAARFVAERFRARNELSERFFEREAVPLAQACRRMSERFQRGGRLLAFGRDHQATDAQHVAVEFVHPVIVGKRALPAFDLSLAFTRWLPALVRPEDIVMGFGPPAGDPLVAAALASAREHGAMTFELPADDPATGGGDGYAVAAPSANPFLHQETIEILYHTLWETVHVFLEHRELGHDVGASAFLYPFLGSQKQDTSSLVAEVAASIRGKAAEDERLRREVARDQASELATVAAALRARIERGGTLLLFGNGGSATDANDWALDCAIPAAGRRAIPAVSLAMEPASISAVANDVGAEAVFLRQLIALARPGDVAIAISTSGGSTNVLLALEEARKRGLLTIGLLGYDGGEVVRRGLADHALVVRSDYVPRIQEVQASMYHVVLELLEAAGDDAIEAPAFAAAQPEAGAAALELFGSAGCPYTRELREELELRGEVFREHDVDADAQARRRLAVLAGGDLRVPVLVERGSIRQVGWQGRSCIVAVGGGEGEE